MLAWRKGKAVKMLITGSSRVMEEKKKDLQGFNTANYGYFTTIIRLYIFLLIM